MTDDDPIDRDHDLQLKQMRSVWLSMRDDDSEPSDRGMAALMAAAREQAEAMKPKRSWLAVLLDQLRKPPVLAMATVVVLIGGAVVISQRGDEMRTETEMAAPAADVADKNAASPPPSTDDLAKMKEPGPGGGEAERDRLDVTTEAAPVAAPEAPVVAQRPQPAPARVKPSVVKKPPVESGKVADNFSMTPTEPPADPKPEPKKEEAKPLQLATGDEDMQSKGGVAESTATGAAPPPPPPVSRKPLPSIEGEDRAGRNTTVAQLVKQCEAAAAKNDCAAVRTIVQKIAKADPAAYRLKLSKNTAVTRCLEPPAPVEAAPSEAAQ